MLVYTYFFMCFSHPTNVFSYVDSKFDSYFFELGSDDQNFSSSFVGFRML